MKKRRPLCFDLDHTLWDFETNSRLALRDGYNAMGLKGLGVESADDWIASYERANEWCWAQFREGKDGQRNPSVSAVQTCV